MHMKLVAAFAAVCVSTLSVQASAQMPTWSAEQQSVWKVVSDSWVDDTAGNGKWPGDYTDPQFIGWGSDTPSPRGRDASIVWSRFSDKQQKVLHYEITPLAIAVSGNTAVASYTLFMVTQRGTDKPENHREGITETLVRSGGSWKYLASVGFSFGN